MKSYLDLLEASLSENVEGTGGDVVGFVAQALGIERKEAEDRLGALPLDVATEIADAASQGDVGEIVLRLGGNSEPLAEDVLDSLPKGPTIPQGADMEDEFGNIIDGGAQMGNPPLDPAAAQFTPELQANGRPVDPRQQQQAMVQAKAQGNVAPVVPAKPDPDARQEPTPNNRPASKASGTVTQSRGTSGTGPRAMAENFGAGDEVTVAGKEGVISGVDDGPANSGTIGVLIDGTLEMVKKDLVKMDKKDTKLDEHVLGFTNMGTVPGMRAMMELAMFTAKTDEDKIDAEIDAAEKGDEEDVSEKAEDAKHADEAKAKIDAEAEAPAAEEAPAGVAGELLVFDISAGTQSNVAQAVEPAAAVAEVETEEQDPREQILKALDVIERNMPDIRMADFRDIRSRLDKVSNMVLERAMNRRPKL